ncbi:glycosyltransferase family 4 protein [Aliarcobacter butzleri]|uniref:glycosyltransferase family 4 protein n=1 Tax=Aliarcobacter butzleri TaxID=28197 RepID=UPI003BAF22BC
MINKKEKILLIYSTTKFDDNYKKGNISFIRHYESHFDKVICFYQTGEQSIELIDGNTKYICKANSHSKLNKIINMFSLPLTLFKIVKKYKPTSVSTPDIIFGGYSWILVKLFTNFKLVCYPVCVIDTIYSHGNSLTNRLPIWIEKFLVKFTFRMADKIIDAKNFSATSGSTHWVLNWIKDKNKFSIIEKLPDALPTPTFFKKVHEYKNFIENRMIYQKNVIKIVTASRLHKEKFIYDYVDIIDKLVKLSNQKIELYIYGDGEERKNIEKVISEKRLNENVYLKGFIKNEDLVKEYVDADIFLSLYTGSALREAMLCGLPVVAYKIDWIGEMFIDKQNILYSKSRNIDDTVSKLLELINDSNLYENISLHSYQNANDKWGIKDLNLSIIDMFRMEKI